MIQNWKIKLKIGKRSLRESLAVIFIFFNQMYYTLQATTLYRHSMKVLLAVAILAAALLVFFHFNIRFNRKGFLFAGVFATFCVFLVRFYLLSNDTRGIFFILACLVGLYLDYKKIIRCLFYTKLPFYIIGLLSGGYEHINVAAFHGGTVVILYMCMVWDHMKFRHFGILFLSYVALWIYTNSGSLKIGLGTLLLLVVVMRTEKGKKIFCSVPMYFVFPAFLLINYFFALCIGESKIPFIGRFLSDKANQSFLNLVDIVDTYSTSRLTLAKYSLDVFGVSFFGGNVDYGKLQLGEGGYFNLDSGYMWLIQGWGVFNTILIMLAFVILMRYFVKTKRYELVTAAITIALWAFNEDMFVSIGTNFTIYFVGRALRDLLLGGKNEHTKGDSLLLVWKKSITR